MELSKKDRDAIAQLAQSSDARKLRELLQQQSGEVGRRPRPRRQGIPASLWP